MSRNSTSSSIRRKSTERILQEAAAKQRNWLIAIRAPALGGARLKRAVHRLGGIDGLVTADSATLGELGLKAETREALRQPDAARIDADLAWLDQPGHHLITCDDDAYPELLRAVDGAPAALFVAGDPERLWQPQVAIVGSRNPSRGGRDLARDFAAELGRTGFAITSGLAEGIDSEAHLGALEAGAVTIAVCGTGLDRVYPAKNAALAARIARHGVLVSEFPPGTGPRRSHFPARNRIISGLSLGVLVVEAGLRSGSLITARQAGEQGREVFAIPGSVHNPMARGCHRLIRDGARLVESTADVLEELAPLAGELAASIRRRLAEDAASSPAVAPAGEEPHVEDDPDYQRLLDAVGFDPAPVDRIVEQSGLTVQAVSSMLLLLELRGTVEAHPGGAYSRKQ